MRTEELTNLAPVSAETLWKAWFYDEAFQHAISKVFQIEYFDMELQATGAWPDIKIHREVMFDTDRNIPGPLLKIVRGVTQVKETIDFDGASGTMDVDLRVPVIGSRVRYGYRYSWDPQGAAPLEVIWKGHCEVRIPLVRGLAEGYLMGELATATRAGYEFVNQWFADRS